MANFEPQSSKKWNYSIGLSILSCSEENSIFE
jgi:hypothetical protein